MTTLTGFVMPAIPGVDDLSDRDAARADVHRIGDRIVACCRELERLSRTGAEHPERSPVAEPAVLGRVACDLRRVVDLITVLASESTPGDMMTVVTITSTDTQLPPLRRVWDHDAGRYRFADVPPAMLVIAEEIERQCVESCSAGLVCFRWAELPSLLYDPS